MDVKGVPEELWVRVSRKRSDANYGSYGVEAELKINLANVQDLNLDDTFDAVEAWLTAAVAKSMKAKTAPEQVATGEPVESLASEPPPPTESPPPTGQIPVSPSPVASVAEITTDPTHIVLKNPLIARTEDGRAKIFGKTEEYNWTRWGVHVWHEVLDAAVEGAPTLANWRDWPQCKATSTGFPDGEGSNRYALPDGLQEAVVLMKMEEGKWKPDKVTELR